MDRSTRSDESSVDRGKLECAEESQTVSVEVSSGGRVALKSWRWRRKKDVGDGSRHGVGIFKQRGTNCKGTGSSMVGAAVWVSGAGSIQGGFAVGREEITTGLDEYMHYLALFSSTIICRTHCTPFQRFSLSFSSSRFEGSRILLAANTNRLDGALPTASFYAGWCLKFKF